MPATTRPALRHLAVAAATAAATTCAATAVGAVVATPASAAQSHAASYFDALNQERVAHGLAPLVQRADLDAVARRWAHQMAATSSLSHNPRLTQVVRNWQVLGENVGEGPTVPDLTSAFWASPEHRANILTGSYRDVGVGTVTRNGTIWITVDFRAPMHAESTPSRTVATHHRSTSHRSTSHRTTQRTHSHRARPVARRTASRTPARWHRILRYGMVGRDVARVQRHLGISADGIFGPITRFHVVEFQRRHGRNTSGVVGRRTWKAITR